MAAKPKRRDLHVPPEIWREILIRMSVKSILRYRSICKSWYSLVSCPSFISENSTRNQNKNANRVLLCHSSNGVCSYSSLDGSSMGPREHDDVPKAFLGANPEIVGSCNGLICFSGNRNTHNTFLIWNPSIRKVVELPRSLCCFTDILSCCGFGFDSKTNDYKALRVSHNIAYDFSNVCEIFYLRKGVWRVICPRMPSKSDYPYIPDCYLDGAVHWSAGGVLLSFSLSDECFREIKLSDCKNLFQNNGRPLMRSVALNGLIHLIMWTRLEDCSVRAMKEYGVAESYNRADEKFTSLYSIDDGFILCFCLYEESLVLT